MATYKNQMIGLFDRYMKEVDAAPASLEDVAEWAIENGYWKPYPKDILKICKEDIAESLRQEKRTDSKGRIYRAKHSVRTSIEGRQLSLWVDVDNNPPRSFMEKSFSQRRKGVVADCFQMKMDVDHYNDECNEEEPIMLVLDFTDDVAEMEALAEEDDDKREGKG